MSVWVLRGGTVVDGVQPARTADVAVMGDRILAVSDPGTLRANGAEVDCRGLLVTPGFIDAHSHTDFTLPTSAGAEVLHRQGVTTVVTGNCGYSAFTFAGAQTDRLPAGTFLNPALSRGWAGVRSYAQFLEGRGLGVNVVPLAGHSSVRSQVLGPGGGHADEVQVDRIVAGLRSALAEGAAGISLGLAYQDGRDASARELRQVADLTARSGKVLATHIRDERAGCPDAVGEVLSLAAASGSRLHISHLKAMGRAQWGGTRETLAMIDDAVASGTDVSLDMYPYRSGATGLANALPAWATEGGDPGIRLVLADPSARARLAHELPAGAGYIALEEVVFSGVSERWRSLQGRALVDVAAHESVDPAQLLLDVLATEGDAATMVVRAMAAEDVDRVLAHPRSVVGSDGWVLEPAAGAHPRNFATFVRTLAGIDDDHQLAEAVRRQTAAVADRFAIPDRGRVAPGYRADLTLLDLAALDEGGGYEAPEVPPNGVERVYVNGVQVHPPIARPATAGRVLLRPHPPH